MSANQWNDTLKNLRTGDWENYWPSHAIIRTGKPHVSTYEPTPTFGLPIWQGQRVPSLLVNCDCGMGDAIQWRRMLDWFAFTQWQDRVDGMWAGWITVMCPWELWSLFGGIGLKFIPPEETNLNYSAVINIMALPHVLKLKNHEISGKPYLRPDWLFSMGNVGHTILAVRDANFTKVGLCLSGNPFNPRDSERSIPMEKAQSLFDLGIPLFNFNKIEKDERLMRMPLIDWNTTAGFLSVMQCLVTVDTAMAHLGGALGIETYLLLKPNCDWRWGDSGSTTPWYDSVRILRGSDEELIEQVKTLLSN